MPLWWIILGSIAAAVTMWLVARHEWAQIDDNPQGIERTELLVLPLVSGFIAFAVIPFVLAAAPIAGLMWLFVLAAKPGRWRRQRAEPKWEIVPLTTRCDHETVPVDLTLTGEVIAQLCTKCWTQLPPDWSWETDPSWLKMERIR